MPVMFCDHVAVLVRDVADALADLGELAALASPPEDFPEEGTREVYVGGGSARLLLLEPIGPGPYRRALERRGPGVHHLCLAGSDPAELTRSLTGWFLHPHSLTSGPETLWACRPGLPLLELVQGDPGGDPFVTALALTCPAGLETVVERLTVPGLTVSCEPENRLTLGGHSWVPPG